MMYVSTPSPPQSFLAPQTGLYALSPMMAYGISPPMTSAYTAAPMMTSAAPTGIGVPFAAHYTFAPAWGWGQAAFPYNPATTGRLVASPVQAQAIQAPGMAQPRIELAETNSDVVVP